MQARTAGGSRVWQGVERLSALVFSRALGALGVMSLERQRSVGRWLGRLTWRLRAEAARVTRINLAVCFPELDRRARDRVARRSLEHTAMLAAESGAVYGWPQHRWGPLTVSLEGDDLLKTRPGGPGVLVLVPHFGNWEYLALILGRHGVAALYDPPRLRSLDGLIRAARSRTGATLLPIGTAGLRRLYRTLADGGIAAVLPDQVPKRNAGVYADFFGQPALTMTLAQRLAARTNARVVLGSALRCPGGFRVRFLELGGALRDPDPVVSATAMNRAIEGLIRTEPEQYQWEYKRFKRPPRGETSLYNRA